MVQLAKEEKKAQSSLIGDILMHGTIIDEDILYSRTIRSVHVLVTNLFALQSISDLMELQFENGLEVSCDHISTHGAAWKPI